jgi:hypothetical protein
MSRTFVLTLAALLGSLMGCSAALPCASVTCPLDQACDTSSGLCVLASACNGVSCPSGQICDGASGSPSAGLCVTQTCGAMLCKNGQVCDQASLTCVNPGLPALGVQIDRVGRPLINTMLTNPYGLYQPMGAAVAETSDQTRATYNADVGPAARWIGAWSPAIAQHLAYFDGLDGSCSAGASANNQPGFDQMLPAYGLLAYLLADDELLVDTTHPSCKSYLAVEQKAVGVTESDCGGRTLDYDVVDTTYTLLTNPMVPLTDGISRTTSTAATFPYFQPPG